VAMERGLVVTDFDERAPCIWTVLEAQGWAMMVEDHRPAIAKLVREFYANLHGGLAIRSSLGSEAWRSM
jgi:hypothetical protein